MGLTAHIAQFVSGPAWPTPDAHIMTSVRNGFIDNIAALLAGKHQPVVQILQTYVQSQGSPRREATVLFGHESASSSDAALINGTAAHALDYDDVGLSGHPSAVLVPALLAEGERMHYSGAQVMRAYLVGYETWAELIGRDADQHHAKGWHPTSVFGIVGVAAAVASLRGLPASTCVNALGIAATLAGGLVANFGSMCKPFHAGRAAASGIQAVNLAQAGMDASPDVLEHHSGFLAALSPRGRFDVQREARLGTDLHFARLGLIIKKYPMCFATHRIIDAALDMVREYDFRAEDVVSIETAIGATQASMLRNHRPQNALEAKFSIEFAVAASIVARNLGLAELQDAFVQHKDVQALFGLVHITEASGFDPAEPSLAKSDRLVIRLRDGRRLDSGEVYAARGSAGSPLSEADLRTKFMDCAASVQWPDAQQLFSRWCDLATTDDVASLVRPFQAVTLTHAR